MNKTLSMAACFVLASVLIGCSQETASTSLPNETSTSSAPTIDGTPYILASEPEGASEVIKVRKASVDGEDVVIVGRIGGSANPWIDGRAAFSIVDNSLKACSDIEGDDCPMPWDYCCETSNLPEATALVKVVDAEGQLLKTGAKGLLGVKELSTVVVQGKAQRDDAGNLTILASGVFVKQE